MPKCLDYHSREYDELLKEARHIGWNDDGLDSDALEQTRRSFLSSLNLSYSKSDEVERIKKAVRGECY